MTWYELGGELDDEIRAAFTVTRAVLPAMTAQGWGRLICLGTGLSRQPRAGMIALGTAKAALTQFARYLAQEPGPQGIAVNVVEPGPVAETKISQVLDDEQKQRQVAATPLGRLARPAIAAEYGWQVLGWVGDHFQIPTVGVAVDTTRISPDDPAVQAVVRAHRRALQVIHHDPDTVVRHIWTLLGRHTASEAHAHYQTFVAPYFTTDGQADLAVGAAAISAVATELGVPRTVAAAEFYRTATATPWKPGDAGIEGDEGSHSDQGVEQGDAFSWTSMRR